MSMTVKTKIAGNKFMSNLRKFNILDSAKTDAFDVSLLNKVPSVSMLPSPMVKVLTEVGEVFLTHAWQAQNEPFHWLHVELQEPGFMDSLDFLVKSATEQRPIPGQKNHKITQAGIALSLSTVGYYGDVRSNVTTFCPTGPTYKPEVGRMVVQFVNNAMQN